MVVVADYHFIFIIVKNLKMYVVLLMKKKVFLIGLKEFVVTAVKISKMKENIVQRNAKKNTG